MGQILYVKVLKRNLQNLEQPDKTYAQSQARNEYDINALAKHMTEHGSTFSRGTLAAVITDMVDCVKELITDGNIVRLGDLGTFNVSLSSNGVCESVVDDITGVKPVFTAADITDVRLRFTPGKYFEKMIDNCTFQETETHEARQARLKEKQTMRAEGSTDGGGGTKPDGGGTKPGGSGNDQVAD